MMSTAARPRTRRLAIDATCLRAGRTTGIERYTAGILASLPGHLPSWRVSVVAIAGVPIPAPSDVQVVPLSHAHRVVQEQALLPWALREISADAAFFPGFAPPIMTPRQPHTFAYIHDGALWRHKTTLSRAARYYYKPALTFGLRARAVDTVLTHAVATAEDLRAHVPGDIPIFPVPPGVATYAAEADVGVLQSSLQAEAPFVLAVGTIEPRKNYGVLLRAWQDLISRGMRIPLRIVGRPGWGDLEAISPDLEELVQFTGAVSDVELAALYATCRLFVMPSIYEGFGLPVVEAMLRGACCVVSDLPVFREIGGGLLRYISPRDPLAWAAAIESAWSSPSRDTAALKGRAAVYEWDRSAQALAAVIEAQTDAGVGHAGR
jgi:glycosyltransferase involved in cell wall biosynthesis